MNDHRTTQHDDPLGRRKRTTTLRSIALVVTMAVTAAACSSDDADTANTTVATEAPAAEASGSSEPEATRAEATVDVRASGMTATIQPVGDLTVHSLTAPVEAFANSTHIIETPNSLVLVDTQFFLPNAVDFRAYADELGKPIDRLYVTHEHPDHFLGSEAFDDVDIFALPAVADTIAEIGDAEVAEKQADFGDMIASSFVTPVPVEPGTVEIDGVEFVLERVDEAEAAVQMVIKIPSDGVIVAGDIVYSGVHLILAGNPDTWTVALNDLQATSDAYPIVLPGHGLPTTSDSYQVNIDWLATASELMATATTGEEFKAGLVEAFPELELDAAIDFAIPFLFPDDNAGS